MMKKTALERFHGSYERSPCGCWLWKLSCRPGGYGAFSFHGQSVDAHRFAYSALVGPIPRDLFVLHQCDVPACVNPDHLFVGTQSDNMQDAFKKGRGSPPPRKYGPPKPRPSRAISNPNRRPGAKITTEIARDIKARLAAGETGRAIAGRHGLHFGSVSDIKRGLTWRDI